jgi:hypothetical protein
LCSFSIPVTVFSFIGGVRLSLQNCWKETKALPGGLGAPVSSLQMGGFFTTKKIFFPTN